MNSLIEVPFELVKGEDPLILRPMTSGMEKSILDYTVMTDDTARIFNQVCRFLGIPEDLPHELKMACVYKVREISFGSDFRVSYQCPGCGRVTEGLVLLEDLLDFRLWSSLPEELRSLKLKVSLRPKEILQAGITDVLRILDIPSDAKSLKLTDLSKYAIALRAKVPRLKKTLKCRCMFCPTGREIDLFNHKFCLSSLSEHTPLNMIKVYSALVNAGFTKQDIDGMLPFEREVHLNLIRERTQQINEATKNLFR